MLPITPNSTVESLNNDTSGQREQSYVQCLADAGVLEKFLLTCPLGSAVVQGDFFHFVNLTGTKFAVWLDKDANGTEPNGTVYTAANQKIEVNVTAAMTAAQVAAAIKLAVEADGDFAEFTIVNNGNGTLTFTSTLYGNLTNALAYAEDEVSASSMVVAVTAYVASSLQNKYITMYDKDNDAFNCWMNCNGQGSNPSATGTAIEAAVPAEATAVQVAAALATAIDAHADFKAVADGAGRLMIANAGIGAATNVGAGNSGFTASVQAEGRAQIKPSPADAVSSLTNL